MARLLERYKTEIAPKLAEELGRKNRLSLPRLNKIVLNMGVGRASDDKDQKRLTEGAGHLGTITGQKAIITKARKSVSGFKIRKGYEIGCKVTLRGRRMYEFLDRLISMAIPRIRDFRGLSPRSFDGHGNYSMGITEQVVFPEVNPDKVTTTQGMDITLCVSGGSDEESFKLLKHLGMPFRKDE